MYGTAAGATSYRNSSCAGACTPVLGRYCPSGSVNASGTGCPVGFACATMGAPVLWCARAAARAVPAACVWAHACVCEFVLSCSNCGGGHDMDAYCCMSHVLFNQMCSTTAGYWCPALSSSTVATKCSAGFYGGSVSYSSASCAGPCVYSPGAYCPAGSYTSGALAGMLLFRRPCHKCAISLFSAARRMHVGGARVSLWLHRLLVLTVCVTLWVSLCRACAVWLCTGDAVPIVKHA